MSATQAGLARDEHTRTLTRRLKVIAEADPGALARILQPFQTLNIVPLRFEAARLGAGYLEVCVDVDATELAAEAFALVGAKLDQVPLVLTAVICD